jgi:predicted O-methyltransferase YrrM
MILPWYGFHVYLNEYITENQCKRIMEIGIYDGENAVNMIKTAIKNHPATEVEYYGFDFFNYYKIERIREKLEELGCKYSLFKGNTMYTLPEAVQSLPLMDIIFIDGGKSFREAWSDWNATSSLMHMGTGVFVHNVGFFGVSKMIDEIPRKRFNVEIFYPKYEGKVALIKRKS